MNKSRIRIFINIYKSYKNKPSSFIMFGNYFKFNETLIFKYY